MKKLNVKLKIPAAIYYHMLDDLRRPHHHAHERVGFMFGSSKQINKATLILLIQEYVPVNDEDYIRDSTVGARINGDAIRKAMRIARNKDCSGFHVHLHDFAGQPIPSKTDKEGIPDVVQSLININRNQPHGFFILSSDSFYANIRVNGADHFIQPELISVIGYPMKFHYPLKNISSNSLRYDRQSFLGIRSQFLFENVQIGLVGLGGGGSHVAQQLAHIGLIKVNIFDNDYVEDTNLNRLIGAWFIDVILKTLKTKVAFRLIKKILPKALIKVINDKWQNKPEMLQECDIVVGCIDDFLSRAQLEAECRRYLIPYVDIGMDVHKTPTGHHMSGQAILSMPGKPCMRCMKFITEDNLAEEAAKYGHAGNRPQVVWPNGVLASSAVGIIIDIITGWTGQKDINVYLSYDGNVGSLISHRRLNYVSNCEHYLLINSGPPRFTII